MKLSSLNIKASAVTAAIILLCITSWSSDAGRFVNPGFRINTEGDDFAPSITADGNIVVFNSKKPEEKSHNIFMSRKTNGVWGDPVPVVELCSDSNDETPFISAEGTTILFASDRPGGFSPPMTSDGNKRITFDIYISRYGEGKWSSPELLKGTVNTTMNERSPSLSRDGKFIFFSRWPYKNIGKSKIFMAELHNGKYINAKELPEIINSGNYEVGFIPSYKDNRYYFSSMRDGGNGGWDIYYTTMTDKGFTKPVNGGAELNTVFDDLYYSETASDYIICRNSFGGLGGYDLYFSRGSVRVQDLMQHKKAVYSKETKLKISVYDSLSGKLIGNLPVRVDLIADAGGKGEPARSIATKTDSAGSFHIFPKDDIRWLEIESDSPGYNGCRIRIKVVSEQFQDISVFLNRNTDTKKISEKGVEQNSDEAKKTCTDNKDGDVLIKDTPPPAVHSIFFNFDSSKIRPDYIPSLYGIVEYLRVNSSAKVVITGYADAPGSRKVNRRISMARALAVKKFIEGLEISPDRITVKAGGEIRTGRSSARGMKNQKYRRADIQITD